MNKSKLVNSTVIVVDAETGFSYSDDFGFARVNSYREDAKGVMRNWMGQSLGLPYSEAFAKSVTDHKGLSPQQIPDNQPCSQGPKRHWPYRHVETRTNNYNYIRNAFLTPSFAREINLFCEAAYYGVLGVRNGGALTAEAGFYSGGAQWNSTSRKADYFGVFIAIAENGVSPIYMDFSSQVPYNYYNPFYFNTPIVPKILYKIPDAYIRHMSLTTGNTPQGTVNICSATVPAYIIFEWEGPSPYLPNVSPLANWRYVIAVKLVKQKFVYDAACKGSPAGFNFYRFSSLIAVDNAFMGGSVAETSFNGQIGPGPAEWYMNTTNSITNYPSSGFTPPGYAPHTEETCSTNQPANATTIPNTVLNRAVLSYNKTFSDGYKVYMTCWTRYYQDEKYDFSVSKVP